MLDINKGKKLTRLDFPKKNSVCPYDLTLARHLENFRLIFYPSARLYFTESCLTSLYQNEFTIVFLGLIPLRLVISLHELFLL